MKLSMAVKLDHLATVCAVVTERRGQFTGSVLLAAAAAGVPINAAQTALIDLYFQQRVVSVGSSFYNAMWFPVSRA